MGYNVNELMNTCQYMNNTEFICNQNCVICCDYGNNCLTQGYINTTYYIDIMVIILNGTLDDWEDSSLILDIYIF